MVRNRPAFSASLKVAVLAIWVSLHAMGSAGLHTLFACGHDEAAETVAHQETASAHWAGLKSAPASASECPACTLASHPAYSPNGWNSVFQATPGSLQRIDISLCIPLKPCRQVQPRAPPLS